MKLQILGYNAFHDVVAAVGPPTNVFYIQSGGNVSKAVALTAKVSVEAVEVNNTVTAFLAAYPSAIETPFILEVGG